MASAPRILAFAGSTRTGSFNKKALTAAVRGAEQAGAQVTRVDLRDFPMPLYDGDLEANEGLPAKALELRAMFGQHDGLLLACPEYNSSISGVLKNTIDWVSRPTATEADCQYFHGKIAALLSASPGRLGGLRGLVTVRSILGNIGVLVLPDQVAVMQAGQAFDDAGELTDAKVRARVEKLGATLADMVRRLKG